MKLTPTYNEYNPLAELIKCTLNPNDRLGLN